MHTSGLAVFYAIALAFLFSQGLKILLFMRKGQFHLTDWAVTGGMPSSHSAVVTALALSVFLAEGPSPLFFTTLVLAVVVIRDALGVRRTAGDEGKLLNEVIKKARLKLPPVHYSLGHLPKEVAAGICIGLLSSLVVLFL